MTNIDQELIDDAKVAGIYKTMGGIDFQLNVSAEKLAKFVQLRREHQASEQEPVAKVILNSAGQVSIQTTGGNSFDVSKYIGESLYIAPPQPQTVKDALEQVLKILHDDSNLSTSAWVEKYGVLENGSLDAIRALIQTEDGKL